MVLELIREENISKYLGLIAGEDLFDMRSGSATCFGVYDEEADIAVSTLSASIYPDYIRIRRLYTIPEYRNRGIATELLNRVSNISSPPPFYVFDVNPDSDMKFFKKRRFAKSPSHYSFITGKLGEVITESISEAELADMEIVTIEQVDPGELGKFVVYMGVDGLLQMPEAGFESERFSDVSMICKAKGKIVAAVLVEEKNSWIQITWMKGNINKALSAAFGAVIEAIKNEFDPSEDIRILVCDEKGRDDASSRFVSFSEDKIRIYIKGAS
jgi:hypothetical protein